MKFDFDKGDFVLDDKGRPVVLEDKEAFGIGFYILINPLDACISVIDMKYRVNLDFFF